MRILALALLVALTPGLDAAPTYSVKTVADSSPPKELSESIRKLLSESSIQLLDDKGNALVELWFRKEIPVKATDEQVKNGLTYREVPVSTLVGALRVQKSTTDYRKQRLAPGVYTLRLAIQPMDGDHMGTAPYTDFCLICPAADDKKPDLMEVKALQELSARITENHPSVLVLFPGTGAGKEARLINKGENHWVLLIQVRAVSGDKKGTLPMGVTLVGASASI